MHKYQRNTNVLIISPALRLSYMYVAYLHKGVPMMCDKLACFNHYNKTTMQ